MKYMLLIYGSSQDGPQPGTSAFNDYMAAYKTATDAYIAGGAMVAGDAFEDSSTATTVRVRNGKTSLMDGPFAETKEMLGGYYILDCPDIDTAIRYAAMIPDAATGAVEIRPVMDLSKVM
jgi:hypothetical protein